MNIPEFLNTINSTGATFKVSKKPGININKLRKIEENLGIKLPDDLVEFYTFSNGLEGDDWIFNIIPLDEVEKDKDDLGIYLVFAEYMIYSEICGLEIDPHDNNRYKLFYLVANPKNLSEIQRKYKTGALIDFIRLYCDKGTFGIFADKDDNDVDDNNYKSPESKNLGGNSSELSAI